MQKSLLSDSDLWEKIVNDDYRAFTALFERHWLILYKTANKYVKDQESCEEIVHDLFLNIWNRRKFLCIVDFTSYLKTSTRYQVYRYLRSNKASIIVYTELYPDEIKFSQENYGYETMLCNDLENKVQDCLKQLPKRSSQIFLMSRKQQLTNDEIAQRLGISKRSVENELTSALKFLRCHFKALA